MVRGDSLRWSILMSALVLTVVATLYPVEEEQPQSETTRHITAERQSIVPKAVVSQVGTNAEVTPRWMASDEDPFSPRGWVPAPPPEITQLQQAAPPPLVEAPPPPPPVLPFKVLGQMVDGTDQVVYLKNGEQVLLARSGDVLEGAYRVVTVSPTQIEFESVGSGIRQSLPLSSQDN